MTRKNYLSNLIILAAFGLGILSGYFPLSWVTASADATSDVFIKLLKLISLPIIFLSITATISGMKDFHEMRRIGRKVFLYTIGTTLVAATVALLLFQFIKPARGLLTGSAESLVSGEQGSYLSFVLNIVPSNLFQAFIDNNVIGIAFVAILFSFAILCLPAQQKQFLHQLFSSLFAATLKVTGFVIALMPIAIWAFTTLLIKDLQSNFSHLENLLLYLGCVVGANLLQGFVILPAFLKWKKVSPWKAFKGMSPALTLAFFSKSSNATLPVTIRSAEQNLGVSQKISSFTLPLCSVINMNGCAAFILTTVLFVSMSSGVTFSSFELVSWIFLATIAAIGNAGVPMGCFFLTSAFLIGMNVPIYLMGIILPFYTILDMIETTLNVWSDACIAIVVDKELAEKPQSILVEEGAEVAP
jgi:Na+/H+-dicarboxylate symporter